MSRNVQRFVITVVIVWAGQFFFSAVYGRVAAAIASLARVVAGG